MEPQFYLPAKYLPSEESRAEWENGIPRLEQSGKAATAQAWIYQTYLHLRASGMPVRLIHELPAEGLVMALAGNLPPDLRLSERVFLAAITADGLPCPQAQLQISQNPAQRFWGAQTVFLPHWPQPGLIPRDPARNDRFETVAFFGDPQNLAPELRQPAGNGLLWEVRSTDRWHDYSDVDCAVAIRSFDRRSYPAKPATKLYNAWLAGVPFIGGSDSAYAAEGTAGRDHLTAQSMPQLLDHLRRLKESPELRSQLVEQGSLRSRERNPEAITRLWRELLEQDLPQRAHAWQVLSSWQKKLAMFRQRLALTLHNRL